MRPTRCIISKRRDRSRKYGSAAPARARIPIRILTAPPIVVGGRIFVLDAEAHIYAFNAKTGDRLWNKRLAPKNGTDLPTLWGLLGTHNTIDPDNGMGGGVASGDGKIFVTTGFGDIFAFDPASGRQLWEDEVGVPILNAPVVDGGRLFVSSHDNHFAAYATADGRRLWDHRGSPESAEILASSSAAVAGDFVIVPYSSGEIFALHVQNGEFAWSDVLSRTGQVTALSELDDIAGRPVVDRDMVFAISHGGIIAAINLASGERAWSHDLGGIQTPWAAGDFVYVITTDQELLCIARADGKVRWIHQFPAWEDPDHKRDPIVWAGPVLVSNRLVVVSSSGYAESISPYDGTLARPDRDRRPNRDRPGGGRRHALSLYQRCGSGGVALTAADCNFNESLRALGILAAIQE